MTSVRVRIFYPADPMGVVAGGVDTFIRGVIKWAPEELAFSLIGMTTDPQARPLGRFTRCSLGRREFDFQPMVRVADAGTRGRIPLSVRFTAAAGLARRSLKRDFDVFDFHRIEPALLFLGDTRPKNAFFHQDPQVLRSTQADIRWKRVPAVYEDIERRVVTGLDSGWCVRASGVTTLQQRYPEQAERFRFLPTWVDTDVFSPVDAARRARLRHDVTCEYALDPSALRIVSVGRLDTQKDPMLLLDAVARLVSTGRRVELLYIGDGVLQADLERSVAQWGLEAQVRFLGLRSPPQVADLLRGADLFAMSSAYEGMPMAMLEAMGCGLPVASTDVGEVRRVVRPGVNGAIAADRSVAAFAACMAEVLDRLDAYRGAPALSAVEAFRPAAVLSPVYDNYRQLAERSRHTPRVLVMQPDARPDYLGRRRERVIGTAVDALAPAHARRLIVNWAKACESRHVCFCNVHSAVLATRDANHREALEKADLVAPAGAPIAWSLRRIGLRRQQRVDGPGTMWQLLADAQVHGIKVGFYGSKAATLQQLRAKVARQFPDLHVAFCQAPPCGPATLEQDRDTCRDLEAAGVGILFVGLGCPKQERWMAEHRGRVQAVMLGVGAAFEYHAGLIERAPRWVQTSGLEWLHRLVGEPRRLWRRYLYSNTVFIMKCAAQLTRGGRRAAGRVPVRVTLRMGRGGRAAARGPAGRPEDAPVDQYQMAELLARVDAAMSGRSGRVIEFIASGEGEGTSTLAAAYAGAAAAGFKRRVLLLTAESQTGESSGVLEAVAQRRDLMSALQRDAQGYFRGGLLGAGTDGSAWGLAGRNEIWKVLRREFDEVVLDMPSSAISRNGVMVASHCDGVIVVLEAEKTRAPVVEALVASLRAVRANLIGTVLNKRQFYVPDVLYRRL